MSNDFAFQAIDEAFEELEKERVKIEEFQRKVNEVSLNVDSPKKVFTMDIDGHGSITGLRFNGTKYRTLPPNELAAMIIETMNKAKFESMKKLEELRGEPLLPGVSVERMAKGDVDLSALMKGVLNSSYGASTEDGRTDDGWAR